MAERNPGCELDLHWVHSVSVNLPAVQRRAAELQVCRTLEGEHRAAWLLKAVTMIDLTTLGGDDTASNVSRLCRKAAEPIAAEVLELLGFNYDRNSIIHTGAVCVYPTKVKTAKETLEKLGIADKIHVAAVATGFPSGQYSLKTRLDEIRHAVAEGADEIDIVIDRSLVLTGQWSALYQEIQQMKEACGPNVHMKAILGVGELGTLNNVYRASLVAMMAGSDFIKTSTGKEAVNATLPFGIVMARAINDYHSKVGYKVGLKPAGGIRTAKDALDWLVLIKLILGDEWLTPELFRFGASGLLGDIECNLFELATGKKANPADFTM